MATKYNVVPTPHFPFPNFGENIFLKGKSADYCFQHKVDIQETKYKKEQEQLLNLGICFFKKRMVG